MRDSLSFILNGIPQRVRGDEAFLTLAELLRERRSLPGTKVVCAEGDCGACTVLVGRLREEPDGAPPRFDYEVVDACILFVHQLDSSHVVTVEGLRRGRELSPVQQAMVDHFGSQCGYCTPGMVVALTGLLEQEGELAEPAVRLGLSGNLCRCTGYVQILEAAAAVDPDAGPRLSDLYPEDELAAALEADRGGDVHIDAGGRRLLVPADLEIALEIYAEHPEAVLVAGATDLGVQHNKRAIAAETWITLRRDLGGLGQVRIQDGMLTAGAGATWSAIEAACRDRLPELQSILLRFGAPQIRNVGTLGGNLANGSPIADSVPFLFVTEAEVELRTATRSRSIPVSELYRGYKETCLEPGELITRVSAPLPGETGLLKLYKMSKRRDLDISTVTAAIHLDIVGDHIGEARLAFGGVGPVVLRMPETELMLVGEKWSEQTLRAAAAVARTEVEPITDVRGSAEFRLKLVENLLLKAFYDHERARAA